MAQKDPSIDPDELHREIRQAIERVRMIFRDMPKEESADEPAGQEPQTGEK